MSFPSARSLHRLEDGVTALVAARRAAGVEEVAERFEQLMRWAAAGDREGTVAGNRGGDDGNNKDNDGNNTEDNDVNNDEDERPCLAPETLLDIIEAEIGPRPDNDVYEVWDAKKEELGMLRHLYAGWEPIFKCGRPPRRMEDAPRPNPRY